MAMALVEGMSEEWKPEQYHDSYREDVLALVEKKVKAKQTKVITMPGKSEARPSSSNVVDLVALLQQSIGKKPGKVASAASAPEASAEDDDEPPPPRKARKPSAANDEEEAPVAKPRKVAAKSDDKIAATAAKPKKAVAAKAAPAKAHSPARRKSAA